MPGECRERSVKKYCQICVPNFVGPIPPELGNLAVLKHVLLGSNHLSGPIPPELGNLKTLEYLDLQKNQLSGTLPASLGQLGNLQALRLSFNNLIGHPPKERKALNEGSLGILEKALGPDHPHVAIPLNSRAVLLQEQQPKVPGAPPIPDWHVKGEAIGGEACDRLGVGSSTTDTSFEEPRIVTLTGLSGTGKSTLASMVVAREDVRMSFHKGVLWLPVGRGAKDRLPELINRLAGMVYETVMRKASRPPRTKVIEKNPEDGAAYIREVVDESSRRFIVVADDVWEVDVLEELKKAGASVLCTTREDSLLPDGPPLQLDQFPREEAEMVLRRAAELDDNELLPEPASELMRRCESVMLDLLLVGRRGEVRGRSDDHAWQTALRRIMEAQKGGEDGKPLSWRAAALRAGLEALACDNPQNKEHYLALAILSAGLASPSEVGAFLLYGNDCSAEDKKAVEQVLGTLERWSIVTLDVDGEYYRVHDTHVDFIQDCLLDTLDSVLPRWRKYISSVQAVNTYTSDWLSKIWGVLGKIEGGAVIPCSYDKVLDPSNAELPKALKKTAELHYDDQDWSDACDKYSGLADTLHNLGTCVNKMVGREEESESLFRRALEIREQTLGPDHPYVSNTLHSLEVCTREAGETGEADKLLRQALAIRKEKLSSDLLELAQIQYSLGVCVYNTGRLQQAEELLKEALVIREGCLGYDHLDVRSTIYWRMWACINVFWRLYIYVRHSYPRFSHYVGLLGLHYMPLHRSGRTHDKRLPAQASRGKSATWSNSILGVIAAADFVSGVAATGSFGERLEPTVWAFLRWLCQAHWSVHAVVITLAGITMYKSIVISIREFKAGNAEFSAAWRETLQAKQAAIARKQGRSRASR